MSYVKPILTNQGKVELDQAKVNNLPIKFTRMVFGNQYTKASIGSLTNVVNPVLTITPKLSILKKNNTPHLLGRVDNYHYSVASELNIKEIGIFAQVGTRAEVLFFYTYSETGDKIPSKEDTHIIKDYVFSTRINEGELDIDFNDSSSVYAKAEEILWLEDKVKKHIDDIRNPHTVSKANIGLSNVTNDKQATQSEFTGHRDKKDNPHLVSKTQLELGNVINQRQISKESFNSHVSAKDNPHSVTKTNIGLGNVDNFKTATQEEALAGTASDLFITPQRSKLEVEKFSPKIEGGYNLNGHWLKFADGTLFCWAVRHNFPNDKVYVWQFPHEFVSAKDIQVEYFHHRKKIDWQNDRRHEFYDYFGFDRTPAWDRIASITKTEVNLQANWFVEKPSYGWWPDRLTSHERIGDFVQHISAVGRWK